VWLSAARPPYGDGTIFTMLSQETQREGLYGLIIFFSCDMGVYRCAETDGHGSIGWRR